MVLVTKSRATHEAIALSLLRASIVTSHPGLGDGFSAVLSSEESESVLQRELHIASGTRAGHLPERGIGKRSRRVLEVCPIEKVSDVGTQ